MPGLVGPAWMMLGLALWLVPAVAMAETVERLSADQLVLLFNKTSRASGRLARYYARARGVRADHILGLELPKTETISRARYERDVVPKVRAFLEGRDWGRRIRCLVTFYDVPIRIGPRQPTQQERELARQLDVPYRRALGEFRAVIEQMERLGRSAATQPTIQARPFRADPSPRELVQLEQRYQQARAEAMRRILKLGQTPEAAALRSRLLQLWEQADGLAGIVARASPLRGLGRPYSAQRLEQMRRTIRAAQNRINALLAKGLTAPERAEARELIGKYLGLRGLIKHLGDDRRKLRAQATGAAFDSELSLLWWDSYPLDQWIVNLLNLRHRANPDLQRLIPARQWSSPILLVSRLDGPSPAVVQGMIDASIQAEQRGLSGVVYIDARGYTKQDGYRAYDRNLRELAELIRSKTKLAVVLDTREALFGPGQCPNACLYCGWYSHKKYVDAFDFVPGAVAFHIASSEAMSLRDPTKAYWCKRLLEDGVAATLGPVDEPYLVAFPMPKDFFGLLLTGRYSLVECFYLSKNFNSWKLLLVGDPLYRPFARNPQLRLEDVVARPIAPLPGSQRPASRPSSRPVR